MVREKLAKLRKDRGISQFELATNICMDQTTYSRKERGFSPITQDEWERIANYFGVDINEVKDEEKIYLTNENCTFNENSIGIQYVSIPNEVLNMVIRYNKKLEKENKILKRKLNDFN